MPIRQRSGVSIPLLRHSCASSSTRFCMAIAIWTQATASCFTPSVVGSPKNMTMASPTYFVDGRAVLQRDLRHFGEIVVEELGEVLRLHLVRDLGEADEVGKADRELLACADDLDVLLAGEDRIVYLRRQVFRELGRQRRQRVGFLREVLLALFELGYIRINPDGAAVLGAAFAHHHPAAVTASLHLRLARIAMLPQPFRDPFLNAAFRILDVAALGGPADDALEGRPGAQIDL